MMDLVGIIIIILRAYMAYDSFVHRNDRSTTANFIILVGWVLFFFTVLGVMRG